MTELNTLNLTYEIFDINFYGFLYDEIVEEFSMSVDTNSFKISYDYDYDKSLKGFYFEPYITEVIDNFSELFSDSNNNTDEVKDFKVETLHVDNVIKDDNTSSWFTNCFSNEKISKLTSFYIDNKGNRMPLSEIQTARVPLVLGEINDKNEKEMYDLLWFIYNDDFLKKNITGIEILPSGSLRMTNRNYKYDIEFGKTIEVERKFDNYKAFFQKAVHDTLINKYKVINLKFTQQVVCSK